jgi:putative endonuclease
MIKNTKEIGDLGEDSACGFLEDRGYRIIERNYRCQLGEVDIVALDEDTLAFIEVKKKTTNRFGLAGEMITKKKIAKIRRTAELYLLQKKISRVDWRIDAVLIDAKKTELIKNITI